MSKDNAMNFELLPNEILLDLFDYFGGIDLLRIFYNLNSRFNFLLYKQFRSYHFRFDSVSKRHFDWICQQHLPFIADQVTTLQLSDHRETPGQINLFFSCIPSFRQFTHLRSLTLSHLCLYEILLKLLDDCQHLSHLTHLTFYSCSFSNASANFQIIINNIWSLSKLTNCSFDLNSKGKQAFCTPTILSTSLKCVTISYGELQWSQLNRLLEHTPRLKHLSIDIEDSVNGDYIPHLQPTLIRLNICFVASMDLSRMVVFFQSMPNLRHLDIDICSQLINGHQWEQIIRDHLPKLETLRLKMERSFYHGENVKEEADNLLNSFRSSFWTDKHRWFVRCIIWDRTIHLETLSGASDYFEDTIPDSWQSTYPQDNPQEVYKNITSIHNTFFEQPISSNIQLPNIEYLHIKLPVSHQFWLIVPHLNQLKTLSISSDADSFQLALQTLLDRAPHLQTLRISQDASLPLQMSLFEYNNTSVRRLNLYDCYHDFNEEKCISLTHSPLGVQCEVLFIRVHNRRSIIHLINNMFNLRSLIVKCADDEYDKQAVLTEHNDEVIQWLKNQLPSTYVIVRDSQEDTNIIIWL